jgi:hypothetical protein
MSEKPASFDELLASEDYESIFDLKKDCYLEDGGLYFYERADWARNMKRAVGGDVAALRRACETEEIAFGSNDLYVWMKEAHPELLFEEPNNSDRRKFAYMIGMMMTVATLVVDSDG